MLLMGRSVLLGLIGTTILCTTARAQDTAVLAQDWITRYESKILAFEALPLPPPGGMVVAGNSNIVMWPNLEADLAPLPAIKRGFGGSTTAELAYYLDRLVLGNKPASVVICEGENDFGVGDDESDIAARHAEIIERIHAFDPKIRIYVIGLKPSPYRFDRWDLYQATNALLEDVCAGAPPCTYIPPPAGLLDNNGKPIPSLYLDDQIHLNAAGYAVWTAAIRPILVAGETKAARTPVSPPGFNAHKT
jgi:lysophospholipase L1-like esterase